MGCISLHSSTGSPRARRGVVAGKVRPGGTGPTYLKSLTDAEDDADVTLDGGLDLAGNELVLLAHSVMGLNDPG